MSNMGYIGNIDNDNSNNKCMTKVANRLGAECVACSRPKRQQQLCSCNSNSNSNSRNNSNSNSNDDNNSEQMPPAALQGVDSMLLPHTLTEG